MPNPSSDDNNIIDFPNQLPPGNYALADLPQSVPVADRTYSTGWAELDEIFQPYLGEFVVVTGAAGSGKSTFIMNLCCNLARIHGIRTAMFVPENEPNLIDKLRRIWTSEGRTQASFDHYARFQCFVRSSIFEVNELRTIDWVLQHMDELVRKRDCDAILIDPWNELERLKPRDLLLTDYIGQCIGVMKEFCRHYNVILIMIAHPTKAIIEGTGRRPTLYDIEGSANWVNKADAGLVIAREKDRNRCQVICEKIRETGAGRLGSCYFTVNPDSGFFTPEYGGVSL